MTFCVIALIWSAVWAGCEWSPPTRSPSPTLTLRCAPADLPLARRPLPADNFKYSAGGASPSC